MNKNIKISLVISIFVSVVTVLIFIKAFEINSMRDFLEGFAMGITGSVGLFTIGYLIWEFVGAKKLNQIERKQKLSFGIGLLGLFVGLVILRFSADFWWTTIIGGLFVGLGTVFNINYIRLKKHN